MRSAFVPARFWRLLFLSGLPTGAWIVAGALIGPVVAMPSFVCSTGNVSLAAMLWGGGRGGGFAGVLAFLYADPIVLPLVDTYRRMFGWRMALSMAAKRHVAMAGASLAVSGGFGRAGLAPAPRGGGRLPIAFDYGFYLNFAAAALAGWLFRQRRMASAPRHAAETAA